MQGEDRRTVRESIEKITVSSAQFYSNDHEIMERFKSVRNVGSSKDYHGFSQNSVTNNNSVAIKSDTFEEGIFMPEADSRRKSNKRFLKFSEVLE